NYSHDFQPGARRFDVGERSNFALMPVAEASLKLILEWTVPRIFETLRLRTGAIAERARAEFGIASVPAHRRAGHYLGLRFRGGVPSDLPKLLAAANVYVSVRGQAMRVTPHVWDTDEDAEKLFAVLKAELSCPARVAGLRLHSESPHAAVDSKPASDIGKTWANVAPISVLT